MCQVLTSKLMKAKETIPQTSINLRVTCHPVIGGTPRKIGSAKRMCDFWLNAFRNYCQSQRQHSEPTAGGALLALGVVAAQTDSRTEARSRLLSMFGRIGSGCGEGSVV